MNISLLRSPWRAGRRGCRAAAQQVTLKIARLSARRRRRRSSGCCSRGATISSKESAGRHRLPVLPGDAARRNALAAGRSGQERHRRRGVDRAWIFGRPLPGDRGLRAAVHGRRRDEQQQGAVGVLTNSTRKKSLPPTRCWLFTPTGGQGDPYRQGAGDRPLQLQRSQAAHLDRESAPRRSARSGGSPVAMPPAQVTEAIAKGVVDGSFGAWELVFPTKLSEVTKYHRAGRRRAALSRPRRCSGC